ncbi:MAG: hypothetical protein LBR10_11330 [Prevotellaceae bacterium]|jgi:hypothetical protein|nr:hypothetical protein [Prevotellaceae bacterium]
MSRKTSIFIIFILTFAYTSTGRLIWNDYANFTLERQLALEKMGDFFDQTIRENFPTKADTSSYRAFFHCVLYNGGVSEIPYILKIDRKKLAKINEDLFKDENYYFFYARYLTVRVKEHSEEVQYRDVHDSVPTIRFYTTDSRRTGTSYYSFHYNPEGYMRRIAEQNLENPLISRMDADMKAAGNFSLTVFLGNALYFNLPEMSKPVVKQLTAVIFWRYICFCGGVDLVGRKMFCECL